jgi:hypothetical protein
MQMLNFSVITLIAETLLGDDCACLFQVIYIVVHVLPSSFPAEIMKPMGYTSFAPERTKATYIVPFVDTLQVSCIQRYSWSHKLQCRIH